MAATSLLIAIAVVVAVLFDSAAGVGEVDTSLVRRICNGQTFSFLNVCFDSSDYVTRTIAEETAIQTGYERYDTIKDNHCTLYAHGSCSTHLNINTCGDCLSSAKTQMFDVCSQHGVGAQIELKDCKLRYEEYDFGVLPTLG